MPVFAYKAQDYAGALSHGTIVADSPRQARDALRGRGLVVNAVEPAGSSTGLFSGFRGLVGKRYASELPSFLGDLATLLGVGIPLLEALDTLSRQYRKGFRTCILHLRERVAAGVGLAEAMAEQSRVFDPTCLSIVGVGERSGTLDESLRRLTEFRQRSQQLRGRVGTALLYPVIVLVTGIAVSIFLMTYVVPNLLNVLVQSGHPLPFATRVVKGISDFLIDDWWVLLILLLLVAIAVNTVMASDRWRLAWHRAQLRIPVIGDLLRKQAVARIALVMATLLRSGVEFVQAARIAQGVVGNRVLQQALDRCEKAVYAGGDIAVAMESSHAFPPSVVQIFAVGQQSGQLESMLDRLSIDYDQQVSLAAARLTSIMEPILILALAVLVGFIAFATVLPILEAGNVF